MVPSTRSAAAALSRGRLVMLRGLHRRPARRGCVHHFGRRQGCIPHIPVIGCLIIRFDLTVGVVIGKPGVGLFPLGRAWDGFVGGAAASAGPGGRLRW